MRKGRLFGGTWGMWILRLTDSGSDTFSRVWLLRGSENNSQQGALKDPAALDRCRIFCWPASRSQTP